MSCSTRFIPEAAEHCQSLPLSPPVTVTATWWPLGPVTIRLVYVNPPTAALGTAGGRRDYITGWAAARCQATAAHWPARSDASSRRSDRSQTAHRPLTDRSQARSQTRSQPRSQVRSQSRSQSRSLSRSQSRSQSAHSPAHSPAHRPAQRQPGPALSSGGVRPGRISSATPTAGWRGPGSGVYVNVSPVE